MLLYYGDYQILLLCLSKFFHFFSAATTKQLFSPSSLQQQACLSDSYSVSTVEIVFPKLKNNNIRLFSESILRHSRGTFNPFPQVLPWHLAVHYTQMFLSKSYLSLLTSDTIGTVECRHTQKIVFELGLFFFDTAMGASPQIPLVAVIHFCYSRASVIYSIK